MTSTQLRTGARSGDRPGAFQAWTRARYRRERLPSLRTRLVSQLDPQLAGWAGPIAVAVIAGITRLWRLGEPRAFVFDETYYAKDAFSLLNYGVERQFVDDANELLLAGDTDVFKDGGAYVVHPPGGKWLISVGEWLFGMTPFGWRFMVALFGTLSVLVIARIARRMTQSTLLGCAAGLLLTVDGLHFVMSRTALLDGILMFFIVAAFGCLLVDRDRARDALVGMAERHGGSLRTAYGEFGPALPTRWWRILAGVCLGLAVATKWSGLFAIVVFGLMTVMWDSGARRAVGVRSPLLGALRRDALPAFAAIVGAAVVVYAASWTGWFASDDGSNRNWAAGRGWRFGIIPEVVRSLWHYHGQVLDFHRDLTSPHSYDSSPWGWLLLTRPVSYFYESPELGQDGCKVDRCSSAILGIGTPALWWIGMAALAYCIWLWVARRDWRAGAVLAGLAATYLPWFLYTERTIFYFYAVAIVPFLVLAVTLMLGSILGPSGASPQRRAIGAGIAGGLVLLVVYTFIYFYPIYSAEVIPYEEWRERMWLSTWI